MEERAVENLKMDSVYSLQMSNSKWKEPPIYPSSASIQEDRNKLTQYITALRLWVKVSGIELRNKVNVVQYDAIKTFRTSL